MKQEQEFKVTKEWLIKNDVYEDCLNYFIKFFPKEESTIPEILKACEEHVTHSYKAWRYSKWLVKHLPVNPEPLVLEGRTSHNVIYNGDVHIKKGFESAHKVTCKNLKGDDVSLSGSAVFTVESANIDNLKISDDALFSAEKSAGIDNLNLIDSGNFFAHEACIKNADLRGDAHFHAYKTNIQNVSVTENAFFCSLNPAIR